MEPTILSSIDPRLLFPPHPPCSGRVRCDLQALTLRQFTEPLRLSLAALGVGVAGILAYRAISSRRSGAGLHFAQVLLSSPDASAWRARVPVAGLLFPAVALASYQLTGHLVGGLALAVCLLAAGGVVGDLTRAPGLLRVLLAAPGALVLAVGAALPDPAWARVLVAAVAAVGAGLVTDLDSRTRHRGLGPVLVAVTCVGLYESVPNPDFPLVLAGVALPFALFGWPLPFGRLGGGGAASAAGLVAWTAAVGGLGMLSAVVAGVACLGLLAVEPVAHLLLPRRRSVLERLPAGLWAPVLVGLVQLGLGAASSRLTSPTRSPLEAGEIALAFFVIAVVAACLLSASSREQEPGREPTGEIAVGDPRPRSSYERRAAP